ncbi:MAG TPA: heme exporter protein CcmD, partial [Cellvibrio sp.]|nr:heme exporter protein CcmD [Cellvibrio sp.]
MDGHGVFVWTAYALVYGILIYLTLNPLFQKKIFLKQLLLTMFVKNQK